MALNTKKHQHTEVTPTPLLIGYVIRLIYITIKGVVVIYLCGTIDRYSVKTFYWCYGMWQTTVIFFQFQCGFLQIFLLVVYVFCKVSTHLSCQFGHWKHLSIQAFHNLNSNGVDYSKSQPCLKALVFESLINFIFIRVAISFFITIFPLIYFIFVSCVKHNFSWCLRFFSTNWIVYYGEWNINIYADMELTQSWKFSI